MPKKHYAAIDIGSNAVRLLIKCTRDDDPTAPLSKVQLVRVPLRLGEDAFLKGKIGKKKTRQMLSLMKAYQELMEIYEVERYRACATSAMRDASNGEEIVQSIFEKTGIRIEIIGGREEAELISSELIAGLEVADEDVFLYVDVGGGSTELNLLKGRQLLHSRSFNIGTVRALGGMISPEEQQAFAGYLGEVASQYGQIQVVGSGGNINKLLRLGAPAERANVNRLPFAELRRVADELRAYTPEERMVRFRLKPDRADVIVPAADIFLTVGDTLGAGEIIVPTKGLSDGIIESIRRQDLNA